MREKVSKQAVGVRSKTKSEIINKKENTTSVNENKSKEKTRTTPQLRTKKTK